MTGIDEHGQKSQPINKKMGFLKKNNAIKSLRTSNVPAMYSTFLTFVIKEQQMRTTLPLYKNVYKSCSMIEKSIKKATLCCISKLLGVLF